MMDWQLTLAGTYTEKDAEAHVTYIVEQASTLATESQATTARIKVDGRTVELLHLVDDDDDDDDRDS